MSIKKERNDISFRKKKEIEEVKAKRYFVKVVDTVDIVDISSSVVVSSIVVDSVFVFTSSCPLLCPPVLTKADDHGLETVWNRDNLDS